MLKALYLCPAATQAAAASRRLFRTGVRRRQAHRLPVAAIHPCPLSGVRGGARRHCSARRAASGPAWHPTRVAEFELPPRTAPSAFGGVTESHRQHATRLPGCRKPPRSPPPARLARPAAPV
eukprot:scaffold6587_cov103-Isochrysis_galbana.AAC.7